MFESLEGNKRRGAADRLLALLLSMLIHGLGILLIVILPLMFFRILPGVDLLTILIAAPVPPPAPPPPAPPAPVREDDAVSAGRHWISTVDIAPPAIPKGVSPPIDEPPAIGDIPGFVGISSGVSRGNGLSAAGLAGNMFGTVTAPALPVPPPPAPKRVAVPVGGKVQEAKLIRKVPPAYPDLALRARISGDVSLEVTVDEEGNVTDIKVLSGHPLLIDETVRAVRQWKYSPTLLNSEPVPVMATVTVSFRLN